MANVACYITDKNYLRPTAYSAVSCRQSSGPTLPIVILTVGVSEDQVANWQRRLEPFNVSLQNFEPSWRSMFDHALFRKGGPTDVTLGRFFLGDAFGNRFDKILYLDGDTLVTSSVEPIFNLAIPSTSMAAVADALSIARHHTSSLGNDTRRYLASIGQKDDAWYFNGGVMLGTLEAWRQASASSLKFFLENTALCHHHDQTALNVTQRGAITPLSTRWNFQSYYRYLGLAAKVAPIIDHFPGEPKPWDFDYWPNGMFSRAYGKIASSIDADSVAEMNLRALPIKTLRNGAKILKMRTVRRSEYLRTVALFDAYEQTAIG